MKMVLRDRRTVVATFVLPFLLVPAVLLSTGWMARRREDALRDGVFAYAVDRGALGARTWIDAARQKLDAPRRASSRAGPRFRQVESARPREDLARGEVDFVLEEANEERDASPAKADVRAAPGAGPASRTGRTESAVPGTPRIRILFRGDRNASVGAANAFGDALAATRAGVRSMLLSERGRSAGEARVLRIVENDQSRAGGSAGLAIGRGLTVVLLFLLLTAGTVVATDTIAGEKERGTLETLLTTSVSRADVVAAKLLAILVVTLAATMVQAVSFLLTVGLRVAPVPEGWAAAVPPRVALLLVVLYLPVAALASAVLLLVSGLARSYREAQLFFFPVFLLGLVPGLAPFLPDLPLRSAIVLVPVAGIAVAVKEMLTGSRDLPWVLATWFVTAGAAAWVTRLAVRSLSSGELLAPPGPDAVSYAGGEPLFRRRVAWWFAVMWAATLVVSLRQGGGDVRRELLVNLCGVLGFGSFLMVRVYRLDLRQALALRPARPAAWVAVAVGAPAAVLTGLGAARLAALVAPVPPALLEGFGRALLPAGVPFWQVLALLALLPAAFEEIAFRGLLLHGLRKRLRPVPLALAVGAAFGLFHFALFRLVPAAFVGVLLSAVTLLTGSIFPAIAWHALNNGIWLVLARSGVPLDDLDVRGLAWGPPLLALAFWILWRSRTPYPDLRTAACPDRP
jgi:sodium transport system permease protein